jgi:serine/threonine protein kinase
LGLSFVHQKGISHRDIKPGNFLYNILQRHSIICNFGSGLGGWMLNAAKGGVVEVTDNGLGKNPASRLLTL